MRADEQFDSHAVAAQLEGERKKRRYAYLAWLCLGSHHLYLQRPIRQVFFWLTLGGLLVWWVTDLFRIPEQVQKYNQRAIAKHLKSLHAGADPRPPAPLATPAAATTAPWPVYPSPDPRPAEPFDDPSYDWPLAEPADEPAPARREWNSRKSSAAVLAAGGVALIAMYIATPPPLHSRSAAEPTYKTLRKVNVRAAPSTASPIRATVARGVILKGRVEKVGSTQWLWITRGAQADRYVALSNLKKA